MSPLPSVSIDDISAAYRRINHQIVRTPLLESKHLSALIKGRVFLKTENLQHTGSFKFRGASNAILRLNQAESRAGVIAYSSGNHGQGVACAAKMQEISATIVMPKDAPAVKIANVRAHGAKVILYDRYNESREEIGQDIAEKTGAILIKPYDDVHVIAGQGTAGIEIGQQAAKLGIKPDAMIVCCGGGGLSAGCGIALKDAFPSVSMLTAEPEDFDDYARSLETGEIQTNAPNKSSICDAIVTPSPGELTFPIVSNLYDGGLRTSDEYVKSAIQFLFENHRLVGEPGGVIALATLMAFPERFQGQTVIVMVSGGNIDAQLFASILKSSQHSLQI